MSGFILLTAASVFGMMTLAVICALIVKNTSIVDLFWGMGIVVAAWVHYAVHGSTGLQLLLTLLITGWGLRLAAFLFITRIKKGEQDHRYDAMTTQWTRYKSLKIALHFYLQAALQILICFVLFPVYASRPEAIGLAQMIGIAGFGVALFGESIADWQLVRFKRSGHSGICRVGLWRASRHPNYFFEWLVWVSLAGFSVGLPGQWWAWVSPVSIWMIMRYMTGPYTERLSVERRGDAYRQYQSEVPMIVPSLTRLWRPS